MKRYAVVLELSAQSDVRGQFGAKGVTSVCY